MSALFAGCDVVVESVADGAEALTLLRNGCYDALILDLMLPRQNGFEILRDLKNTQPEILKRTIVLTAVSESTLRDFDDGHLVRKVMHKPFEIDALTREVLACRELRASGEVN